MFKKNKVEPKVSMEPTVAKAPKKSYPEGSWTGKNGHIYIMENGDHKRID